MPSPDVVIAGAGLVGLACALECERRGLSVLVLERDQAMRQASWAAAGMLAAHDPAHPAALSPLAESSIALYPAFLQHVEAVGRQAVPYETEWTLEQAGSGSSEDLPLQLRGDGFRAISERSLDPRKLAAAVLAAVHASSVMLRQDSPAEKVIEESGGLQVFTVREHFLCGQFLDCTGTWSQTGVRPAKGQMLRVHAPGLLHTPTHGNVVVRTDQIYLVPRLDGSVVIGATVEDAGFDTTLHTADLDSLVRRAASLVPSIAGMPRVDAWAGLRPDTPDHLPLLGQVSGRRFVAAGHFRNGILLAPVTARMMVQMLLGEPPEMDVQAFAPGRFAAAGAR